MAPVDLIPHGPKITRIFVHPPEPVVIEWIISLFCWLACIFFYLRHRQNLMSAPDSRLRKQYLAVIAFPLVISSLSLMCSLSVRAAYLWFLGVKLYEARTLYAFLKNLMMLLGKDPDKIADKLQEGVPRRIYSAPPLMCCLYPCTRPTYAPSWLLRIIPDLVFQFIFVVPLTGIIELWLFLDELYTSRIPEVLEVLSMLLAMQGLFIIYIASYDVLKLYNPTKNLFVSNSL